MPNSAEQANQPLIGGSDARDAKQTLLFIGEDLLASRTSLFLLLPFEISDL